MRRLIPVLLGLLVVVLVTIAWLPGPAAQTHGLEGAWLVQSWTSDDGTIDAQPGLIVFSETHYSLLFVNTEGPRSDLSEESSDADVAAAYSLKKLLGECDVAHSHSSRAQAITLMATLGWRDRPRRVLTRRVARPIGRRSPSVPVWPRRAARRAYAV